MHRFLTGSTESSVAHKKPRLDDSTGPTANLDKSNSKSHVMPSPTILKAPDLIQANEVVADKWVSYSGIMYKLHSGVPSTAEEMIAFDMDGTLIKTKSGKVFPVNENDWTLWDTRVRTTLQRLHGENKYLAIISNQSGIQSNKVSKTSVQQKVDKIIELIGVPMDFICAIEDDHFRKPRPGMWEFLAFARRRLTSAQVAAGTSISTTSSVDIKVPGFPSSTYVGDAAGRPKDGTRGKDFSDSDYKLALNLGIKVIVCLCAVYA